LADRDALCLHRKVKIEQNRVVGDVESSMLKVATGKAGRFAAEIGGKSELG
jgi:hypothetical protein